MRFIGSSSCEHNLPLRPQDMMQFPPEAILRVQQYRLQLSA